MRIEAHCSQVGLAESARIDYDESAKRAFDESAKAYDDEQAQDFDESARSTDGSDISSASSNEKYFHKKFGKIPESSLYHLYMATSLCQLLNHF